MTITRRQFLSISGFGSALAALAACKVMSPESVGQLLPTAEANPFVPQATDLPGIALPPTGSGVAPTGDWLTLQTLRRITFGPTRSEIDRARQIGIDNFIDEQLDPESIEEDARVGPFLAGLTTLTAEPKELLEIEPRNAPAVELIRATAFRSIASRRQLYELMVDFWSNHFNIYIGSPPEIFLKPTDDRSVIRPHALGNFNELLQASAKSPAMLTYLDNAFSHRGDPNENYARELLELHTLGVDGGYTQSDVEATARILTGWTIGNFRSDANPGHFRFEPRMHDQTEKTVLGQTFLAAGGLEEGEALLAMLAGHPATATYLATKLCRRFVSDDPPAALIDRAAASFLQTEGDIRQVLSTILHSEEFRRSLGTKLKRPFEFLVSALRVTEAQVELGRRSGFLLNQMGQPLFYWPSPDGYPDRSEAWTSTSGMMARWNFALALAADALDGEQVDWTGLAGDEEAPEARIETLWARLIQEPLPEAARQILVEFAAGLPPEMQVRATGALLIASPYFQYR